jgi:glycosyltransferase involved in cell wall biosynthesis
MRKLTSISIIIPVYNEEEVIENTHQRITSIMQAIVRSSKCSTYEILYVNDGSEDKTQKILEDIYSKDNHTRVLVLRKNFGLQGALSAGLAFANGDAAVTIDADLQDPPEKIEEMITCYEQGHDLVLGIREDRQTDTFFKRSTAECFYSLVKILGVEIIYNHGDFRLMARALIDEFNGMTERNRFIRAMVLSLDDQYATVFYKRQPRLRGTTKFSLGKMLSFSLDGILSFTFMPLRMVSIAGILCCLFAVGGCFYSLYSKISGHVVPGWTSTVLPLFIFSGIQLLSLGVIGEYIGRLYVEIKQRPLFSIRRELRH